MYESDSEDSSSGDSDGSGTSEREYARGHLSDTDDEEEDEEEVVVVVDKRKSKEKSVTSSLSNKRQKQRPKAPVTKSLNNRHQEQRPETPVNTQLKTLPSHQKPPKPLPEFSPSKGSQGTQKIVDNTEKKVYKHKHKEPPLTRREYMETRRKIHKMRDPGLYEPPKPKKVPGRHAKNIDHVMRVYHKVFTAEQSDIQSDYEGYLSDVEVCDHAPRLKRSESSESIFLDDDYVQFSQKKLSAFHEQCLHTSKQTSAKQRRLTMKLIRHKHSLNYAHLTLERNRHIALNENRGKGYPFTAAEIDKTKKCIRFPSKFKKENIPRVYSEGDAPLINIVFEFLKENVDKVVEEENFQVVCKIWLSSELQQARFDRRKKLETLPIKGVSRLPKPEYLCMEMLHSRRVFSREQLEYEKRLARKQIRMTAARLPDDKQLQLISREELMIRRNDAEFEKYWKDVVNRTKQLENSSKIESMPTGSLHHYLESQLLRALQRRENNCENPKLLEGIKTMMETIESGREWRKTHEDTWKPAYARMEKKLFKREKIERDAHIKRQKKAIRTILSLANNLKNSVKNNDIQATNRAVEILEDVSDDDDFEIQRMADELHEEASKSVKAKRAKTSAERQRLRERNTNQNAVHRNLFSTLAVEVQKNTSMDDHGKKRDLIHREDTTDLQDKKTKRPKETASAQEDDRNIGLERSRVYVEDQDHFEGDENEMDEIDEFSLGGIDDELMREESALDMYPEVKIEYMENEFGEIVESPYAVKRNRQNKIAGSSVSVDEYEMIDDDIFIEPVAKKPRHVEDVASDRTPSPLQESVDNDGNNFLISDDEHGDHDDEHEIEDDEHVIQDDAHNSDGNRTICHSPVIFSDKNFKTNLLYISKHLDNPSYKDAIDELGSCEHFLRESVAYGIMQGLTKIMKYDYQSLLNYLEALKEFKNASEKPPRKMFNIIAEFFKYSSYGEDWTFEMNLIPIMKHLNKKQEEEFFELLSVERGNLNTSKKEKLQGPKKKSPKEAPRVVSDSEDVVLGENDNGAPTKRRSAESVSRISSSRSTDNGTPTERRSTENVFRNSSNTFKDSGTRTDRSSTESVFRNSSNNSNDNGTPTERRSRGNFSRNSSDGSRNNGAPAEKHSTKSVSRNPSNRSNEKGTPTERRSTENVSQNSSYTSSRRRSNSYAESKNGNVPSEIVSKKATPPEAPPCRQLSVNEEEDLTRMADSETADIMSRNRFSGVSLPSSLTLPVTVTKTSCNAWVAPVKPVESVFWDRIQVLQYSWHEKDAKRQWEVRINKSVELDLAQELEKDKSIANLAKLRDLSDWVYPTLALCHLFLTGEAMEEMDFSSDWSLSPCYSIDYVKMTDSLKRVAIYLREACQIPENLFSLLKFNGFPLLFQAMSLFLQSFMNSAADVKVVYKYQEYYEDRVIIGKKELFSFLLMDIGKRFEYKGRNVKEEFVISHYLLTNTEYVENFDHIYVDSDDDDYVEDKGEEEDEERARKIRKAAKMGQQEEFEKRRVIRINTLKKWYDHEVEANSFRLQVYRNLSDNLKSRMPYEEEEARQNTV